VHALRELLLYYSPGLVQRGLDHFGLGAVDISLRLSFRFATSLCCGVICGARVSRLYSLHGSMNSLSGRSSIRSGRNGIYSGRNGIPLGRNGIDSGRNGILLGRNGIDRSSSGISSGSNAIPSGSSGIPSGRGSFIDSLGIYNPNRLTL
jgi:hypothetical protein